MVGQFNALPVKSVNGSTIYMRDIAQVRDGYMVQTNIVRHNGERGALLTALKNGGASTIDIVKRIKEALPRIASTLPPGLKIDTLFDQSIFVRAAIKGVLKEAARRRRPDRPDDSAVPGELAQHADRLHFDPALDLHLAGDSLRRSAKPSTS